MYAIKRTIQYLPKNGKATWDRKVYMPISLNNGRVRDIDSLKEIISYVLSKCNILTFVIGDFLHRHNIKMLECLQQEDAEIYALKQGEEMIQYISSVADSMGVLHRLIFVSSKEFYDRGDFMRRLEEMEMKYETNEHFKLVTEGTIDIFMDRIKGQYKCHTAEARDLCRKYLLEEIIIFEILAEAGLNVNVYPGNQLPAIIKIVAGKIRSVSETIETITLIEIKFKPTNHLL